MRDEQAPLRPKPIEKRIIRFDNIAKGDGESPPRAESRSLLGLFRLWNNPPAQERRRAPRHEVVESQVWLRWWRAPDGLLSSSALIINLSRGGALVFLDVKPPKDQPVWIGQGTADHVDFVETRVVAIKTSRQGQCAVRLQFREPCPYGFFEAAICGMSATDPRRRNRRPAGGDRAPRS
jgi:PilZ domain